MSKDAVTHFLGAIRNVYRVVIAVSSGFTSKLDATNLVKSFGPLLRSGCNIMCEPFKNDVASQYLKSLRENISASEITHALDVTKGIPRLLSYFYLRDGLADESISESVIEQFSSVVQGLYQADSALAEMRLLVSAYYEVTLAPSSRKEAQNLIMARAKIVNVNQQTGLVSCCFKLTTEHLTILNTKCWRPYVRLFNHGISTEAGMGDIFQGSVGKKFLPNMNITTCKIQSPNTKVNVVLKFANVLNHIPLGDVVLTENVLHGTKSNFPGIDFICHYNKHPFNNTLIGIQATIQKDNVMDKVKRTLDKFPRSLAHHADFDKLLMIIVNPNWSDLFTTAETTAASASLLVRAKMGIISYGELVCISPIQALMVELHAIFSV